MTSMTKTVRMLMVPPDTIPGLHARGAVRAWVDSSGDITAVNAAAMDETTKLRVAAALMILAEKEGLSPNGVAFI